MQPTQPFASRQYGQYAQQQQPQFAQYGGHGSGMAARVVEAPAGARILEAAYGSCAPERRVVDPEGSAGRERFSDWHDKDKGAQGIFLDKGMFLLFGIALLVVLCVMPVWDAIEGLRNFNYVYWVGRNVLVLLITCSVLIVVLFFFITEAFFGRWREQENTIQSLVMMTSFFITVLGLIFVMTSLPMSSKAIEMHNDIMHQCANAQDTRELRSYYLGLLDLRLSSACAGEFSIEDCKGYKETPPMSTYLKYMEQEFRCSGFCLNAPVTSLQQVEQEQRVGDGAAVISDVSNAAAIDVSVELLHRVEGGAAVNASAMAEGSVVAYPPTLFSTANFKVSCDGAAARDMINYARVSAYQTWYTGILLIALSIIVGLWDWTSVAK